MNKAYLLLGGNIGNREKNLSNAVVLLHDQAGEIITYSKIYETAAWGKTDEPNFLNQVICITTPLESVTLMEIILTIERQMGRTRSYKNASRIIDIDILFFNTEIISTPDLIIPHPEITNRRFVLVPMAEIAPEYIHPVLGETVLTLLTNCKDELEVNQYLDNSTIDKL